MRLAADSGPFGTKNYAIFVEIAPLDEQHTILHLAFSQQFGFGARLAMLAYFSTVGRSKVGFTVVDRDASGRAQYVGDLRGGFERNVMRHYFAILAYLESAGAPGEEQAPRRLRAWLAYTQRYPLQLREEPGYFDRKIADLQPRRAQRR